jgi:hypothetical protein
MKADRPSGKIASVSAANFPALRSFLRGYFHQDMKDEYGSAEEAVAEFCEDASPDERTALASEWSRFLEQTKNLTIDQTNKLLTGTLGSSYSVTAEEVQKISSLLSRHTQKPH